MWTPKRILILAGALLVFLAGYSVYAFFLGKFDGLPPLPPDLARGPLEIRDPKTPGVNESDRKLAMAFGAECEELRREIKLDLRSRGIAISANNFDIEPDGRVKLSPFSAALFPKGRPDAKFPEINIVMCEVAFLTLDRPVTSLTEMGNRRIVGVEFKGREIILVNNRRTPEKNDDVELFITNDSLYYDETRNLIWTDGFVQLLDTQTQPHPTKITSKGLELHLTKEADKQQKAARTVGAKKTDNPFGVDFLVLKSNVDMHLYVDGDSGFLSNGPTPAKGAKKTSDRAHIAIKTEGVFHYDMNKDLAKFDSPNRPAGAAPAGNDQVLVTREHKVAGGMKFDQLVCHHLELQFRRKARGLSGREQGAMDKEIDSALATAKPGKELTLTLDEDNLEAYGSELQYRCAQGTTGAQTMLKGSPLHAIKDGNKIKATELLMVGADAKGGLQQAFAKGPGQIDLFDKSNKKTPYPLHALFTDSMLVSKDKDGDKVYDLLTLTGNAAFIDEDHQQELHGQRLQVWLEQAGQGNKQTNATAVSRQRPHKVDAFEKVKARSPEMIVKHTHHLVIRFRHEPPADDRLPEPKPVAQGNTAEPGRPGPQVVLSTPLTAGEAHPKDQGPPPLGSPPPLGAPAAPPPAPAAKQPAKRNPIELTANEVAAYVTTQGTKKQLQELVCEGAVHVHQEGDNAKDKGVDITGTMLNLVHHPLGDTLFVFGDSRKFAQLQLGELVLVGPKVTINQKDNIAEVEGAGAMTLPSNTTFDGGKPARAGTRLTIHWNKDMLFNGKYADFNGGVNAVQEEAVMKCQTLQVTLDRAVSFKEGQQKDQPAKVEKLLCNRQVFIDDKSQDVKGFLVQHNRLEASQLAMDNQEGPTIATGPGKVFHLAPSDDEGFNKKKDNGPGANPGLKKERILKLTRVDFENRMFSNTKDANRNAKFYGNVDVYHLPTTDLNAPLNPNQPPKDGFYLRCDLLTVSSRLVEGKSTQMMEARKQVTFTTEDFFGRAEVIKYNESEETVVFEGVPGNPAVLYKKRGPGQEPQEIKGNKILYNRKTGEFILDGGRVITSWLHETPGWIQQPGLAWTQKNTSLIGAL